MVMACSSVHRRDDTLDLVQVVPKVDKIILVYSTIIQEICLLVLTTTVISCLKKNQTTPRPSEHPPVMGCTSIPGSYFSVKSKHVLKIKHGKYQVV